nr:hypothetical protein [Rhizobium phaseoli]
MFADDLAPDKTLHLNDSPRKYNLNVRKATNFRIPSKNILYPLVVIQEAELDGFWLGRVLSRQAWIESHIVEAASIAMPLQHRRAHRSYRRRNADPRSDGMEARRASRLFDGQASHYRGRRYRRIVRERKTLIVERI